MPFNKSEYDAEYFKANIKPFMFGIQAEDADAFESFCESIGMTRSAYIKSLVNEDMKRRGLEPIFRDRRTAPTKSDENLIPASEYAKLHNINRTTMIMRCKSGKYTTARQINGKWCIDPNEEP